MIEVGELSKSFGSARALDRLNLEVRPGERVALVGQNGSGKTTLIRCLLGLYQHDGKIRLAGRETRAERRDALRLVGFVPQIPPGLRARVRDYVSTVSKLCGIADDRVASVADRLGLDLKEVGYRRFTALSGGMKQKLMIAVALARAPELLIMDEPGANLDPVSRSVFFELLCELPRSTTMLLSSHRVDEIAGLVTRVVELDDGRVVMDECVAMVEGGGLERATRPVSVRLTVDNPSPGLASALMDWGLSRIGDPGRWEGVIPSADRFRFLALVTRHASLIKHIELSLAEEAASALEA